MRQITLIFLTFLGIVTLTNCGDDTAIKLGDDVQVDALLDTQVAVDTGDDAPPTANDVTSTTDSGDAVEDADAITPADAATAETADNDAPTDATTDTDDAVSADAADADDVDAATDATDSDVAIGEDALADAATDDATVEDVADAASGSDVADASDAADGLNSDTWTPCVSGVTCEDGDPCTVDLCWDLSCKHVAKVGCSGPLTPCDAKHPCAPDAGVCDPSRNACVPCVVTADCGAGFACLQNACMPAVPCKSDVACKNFGQVCNKTDGVCAECAVDGDCGKGNQCVNSACQPAQICGSSKDCPAVCDLKAGLCVECVDSIDCTSGNTCSPWHACVPVTCKETTCASGAAFACTTGAWSYSAGIDCEDGNVCTSDACVPGSGCKKTLNTLACDDNNACTVSDVCTAGFCSGAVLGCNDENPCTADSCDPTSGCLHTPAIGPCDDGSACTTFDQCVDGACTGKVKSCEDNNLCTADSCEAAIGCRNLPAAVTDCDDGDACTLSTQCGDGKCQGGIALDCDDGEACTTDTCDKATGCGHAALSGTFCSDANACTDGDTCKAGKCVSQASVCNDKNPCTTDSCDPTTGCIFKPNALACDDGDPCSNGDTCTDGACKAGSIVDCNDKNPCTTDLCDGKGGCTHPAVADKTACDDGDPCTLLDMCMTGACKASAIDCNDKNDCTADSCVGGVCKYVNIAGSCDDFNGCTIGDTCSAGKCEPGKAVDCTVDTKGCGSGVCKSTGSATYACTIAAQPDGTACNADNNGCTVGDACKTGACVVGAAKDCSGSSSKDGCQVGTCQSLSATTNACTPVPAALGTSCNADSNGCTQGDACNGLGACTAGAAVDCNQDPAYCTAGVCKSTGTTTYLCAGGTAKTDGTVCNADNSGCTQDTCKGGKCVVGAAPDCSTATDKCNVGVCKYADWSAFTCVPSPIACSDGDICTDDACALPGGCAFTPNTAACDDNNVCTLSDTCAGGKCGSTTPADCTDNNVCTTDACDPAKGCVNTLISCDDADPCTVDTCDSDKGCLHALLSSCVLVPVPYVEPFNCGGAFGWTLGQTVENGVGWAVDGTPAQPGYLSPSCSLNFNNGVDFACVKPMEAFATSPVIDTSKVAPGTHLALRFFNNGDYEGSTYDKMSIEITTNSGVNWTELLDLPSPATLGWVLRTIDLTPYVGTAFQLRFRFWTLDCIANSTVGGFIDDLAVYTTSCGSAQACDDKNSCTTDACDKLTGQCTFTANTSVCNDGSACTTTDTCAAGVCTGTATNCDDANVCTADACDATTGKCTHSAAAAGTTCTDNNVCTTNDTCNGTTCTGGASPCNDGNPCTLDFCAVLNGAASCSTKNVADATPCDDGNACTTPDACISGVCGGPDTCGYTTLYSQNFACGANNGWTLQTVGKTALAWAVDATPATPGYYSASCSLNFNDGVTYGSTLPAVANATSPAIVLPPKATNCKLSLYSWSGLGFFNSETRTIALIDTKTNTDLVTYDVPSSVDNGVWTQVQLDCLPAMGHTVNVQLRFSDAAGPWPFPPSGAGWFVDDVLIAVGGP